MSQCSSTLQSERQERFHNLSHCIGSAKTCKTIIMPQDYSCYRHLRPTEQQSRRLQIDSQLTCDITLLVISTVASKLGRTFIARPLVLKNRLKYLN